MAEITWAELTELQRDALRNIENYEYVAVMPNTLHALKDLGLFEMVASYFGSENGYGNHRFTLTDLGRAVLAQADSVKPEAGNDTAENLHNEWIAEKIRFQDRFTELMGKCQSYEDQLTTAREQVARLRALEADNVRLLEAVDTIYALLQTLPIGGTYTIEQHATVGKAYDLSSLIRRTISRPIAAALAGDEGGA